MATGVQRSKGAPRLRDRDELVAWSPEWHVTRAFRPRPVHAACVGLTVESQEQTLWCWAAVAASVGNFYHPSRRWKQCQVANLERGRDDCCAHGESTNCNAEHRLDLALIRVGCFGGVPLLRVFTFEQVKALLSEGRPPCARQQWTDSGVGHFVAIVCWAEPVGLSSDRVPTRQPWLKVSDPLYGDAIVSYATFREGYLGRGVWTDSYKTMP